MEIKVTLHDERLAEFAQTLDAFSEGGRISIAQNPDQKPWDVVLARVHPVSAEFWSIRVTAPEETPGIRAFGGSVGKDEFAVLTWHLREEMSSFDADVRRTMALVGASIERWAVEFRHLQRTEVLEAEEPFTKGQKGSSAMPHKRNPITWERLTGLARVLRGNASPGGPNGLPLSSVMRTRTGVGQPVFASMIVTESRASERTGAVLPGVGAVVVAAAASSANP